jgi:hypothetical protein
MENLIGMAAWVGIIAPRSNQGACGKPGSLHTHAQKEAEERYLKMSHLERFMNFDHIVNLVDWLLGCP